MSQSPAPLRHPRISRRTAVQAGAISLLGLGMNHVDALAAPQGAGSNGGRIRKAKSVIYIFLSGGLSQHESFDPKPDAPDDVRGEFQPINTRTPGLRISEHLPMLAERSQQWAVVRSLTHPYNEHSQGHMVMLTGQSQLPVGFDARMPRRGDWPSIASVATNALLPANNLPPAVVLPEKLVHRTGRVIPGQFAGQMGSTRDPWFVEASPYNPKSYGAFPEYEFHHANGQQHTESLVFQAPNLNLPTGLTQGRMDQRRQLVRQFNQQRSYLESAAAVEQFDRHRQSAISLLTGSKVGRAFDPGNAADKEQDRYGRNSFGRSLLVARRMVELGVGLVQVNLGNNETWDTHQALFPNLKNYLLPPTDRAVSALIDDLEERGLLDETLIVMAGEFGRTPRVFNIPKAPLPGRDHWGAVQSVFLAGGGIPGGAVIGASDAKGGYPIADPQKPENLAATIYEALGLPRTAAWLDDSDRPHHIYAGEPIRGLS